MDVNDSSKTTKQILEKYLPSVIAKTKADSEAFYFGNPMVEEEEVFRQMWIGKLLEPSRVIAIEVNIKDTNIQFFELKEKSWKLIGSNKMSIPFFGIEFKDLTADQRKEIVISSTRNMNANTFQEVYFYSDKTSAIHYAGSFSTDYVIKKDKKQIEVTYEGSAYMDPYKALYEWRNEMLVPVKKVVLAHKSEDDNTALKFEYYENNTSNLKGLTLMVSEPYNEENKKQKSLWDNFFRH